MKRLLSELQRRRVLRVTGVYLIAAWAAIQVADTVFPNLGMPSWSVRMVIILAALALPVVIALAWTFDLTKGGVQRTEATGPADASSAPGVPSDSRHGLVAIGAVALFVLLGLGAWWLSVRGEEPLDNELVAVMPFRVAGADASLGYLREGLMDLLAATLTGRDGVPAAVSPRTLTQVLRERLGSLDADPSEAQALEIARTVGAGRVLEGELVGSGDNLTVSARLFRASDGREVTRTSIRMHADSLHRIVDRIAARLIAAEAGLGEEHLASVTTTSLPALRAYLDGSQAFRHGDHFAAVHAWDRALDLDSTFALAALGLSRATGWTIVPSRHSNRAFAVAWGGRQQLSHADRVLLDALSPRYPLLATYRDLIESRQQAVERFPHDPDLRFLLGDGYLHYGAAAGFENVLELGRTQLARVVAVDSTHFEALIHLYDIAQEFDDSVSMRRYGNLLLAVDSSSASVFKVRHDRSPDAFDLDTLDAPALIQTPADGWLSTIDTSAVDAIYRAIGRAESSADRDLLNGFAAYLALWEGQTDRLWELLESDDVFDKSPSQRLRVALFAVGDTQRAAREADELRNDLTDLPEASDSALDSAERIASRCMLAHWEVAAGSVTEADRLAADLDRWAASRDGPPGDATEQSNRNTADLCADLVLATLAVRTGAANAAERLGSVDARLAAGVRMSPPYYDAANLHVGRLWRALDRPERALASVRRRILVAGYIQFHVDALGEEARILDDLGRRDEAIETYARFLGMRVRAEDAFAEQAARDRARLATLVGERG